MVDTSTTAPDTRAPRKAGEHPAQPYPAPLPNGDDGGLDIAGLLMPLWRRKWIILVLAVLATLAGLFYVSRQETVYTAQASMIFEPERLRIIDLSNVVAPERGNDAMRNQIEVLRSALVLERVIDTLRLDRAPEFALPEPPSHLLDGSRLQEIVGAIDWPPIARSALRRAGLLPRPQQDLSAEERADRHRRHMLRELRSGLSLRSISGSRVIEASYSSTNAVLAAAIVNAAVEQYVSLQTEQRRDDIAQATELLSVRVSDLENRTLRAEEAVQIAQLELATGTEHGSALIAGQIEGVTNALAEAARARAAAEERYLRASLTLEEGGDLYMVPEFLGSSIIAGYRGRETELLDQEVSMRSLIANANNPALIRLQARLSETQRNIADEARRIVTALAAELEAARVLEGRLAGELAELEQRSLEQARVEMRLSRLQREAEAVRSMYETFLGRMNETMEQAALQAPDARFLSRAQRPDTPDTSRSQFILLAAAGFGAGLGVALILLLEQLNNTFRRSSDVETATGLTVLAGVPKVRRGSDPKRLLAEFLSKPSSALAESARNLRTSILFSNLDQAPRVIMFTSSLPNEGKTSTALLAAVTSQQMERSAVIVDCDFRRGSLSRAFGQDPERPGLFAALQGTVPLDEAIYVEPETGVHVLALERVGHGLGGPADILASRRFGRLIAQLKARYDLVILDTPPVLAVTDPRILAPLADAVVYLVRWGHTRQGAVHEGIRELRSVNARLAGVAITMVDERQARKYLGSDYLYKKAYG